MLDHMKRGFLFLFGPIIAAVMIFIVAVTKDDEDDNWPPGGCAA